MVKSEFFIAYAMMVHTKSLHSRKGHCLKCFYYKQERIFKKLILDQLGIKNHFKVV